VRAKLPDRDTVLGLWNNDVIGDDEFLMCKIILRAQPRLVVERNKRGSLT
jgi:hypothetical protein